MRKFIFSLILLFLCAEIIAQSPSSFNYQAVVRNSAGDLVVNQDIGFRISILQGASNGSSVYSETQNANSNAYGICNLKIGEGTLISGNISTIDWSAEPYFLKVELDINGGTSYTHVGTSELLSVPYSLFSSKSESANSAINAENSWNSINSEYALYSDTAEIAKHLDEDVLYFTDTDTLFAVKDRDGNIVFAVFPDGAKVYVNESVKGRVGGFAVSGRSPTKSTEYDVFNVTPDSARFYVNESVTKGRVGGFAVSGRSPTKGVVNDYLQVTPDSTRVYVNESVTKGRVGGFAVSGRSPTKGVVNDYLQVTPDSTRIYINETVTKGRVGGFAVSGRSPTKGDITADYFNISGNENVDVVNSQARILWYPKKEAFLTGHVLVEGPDSVGTNSMATGFESKAIGNYSQAMGYQSRAVGDYSTAIGLYACADSASFAFGNSANASGKKSYAFGSNSLASGEGSFALGSQYLAGTQNTEATGDYSYALGMGAVADTLMAVSIGTITKAKGISSVAMGNNSDAYGNFSVAMGYGNIARGGSSLALGFASEAVGSHSVTIGNQSIARASESAVLGYKNISKSDYSVVMGTYNDTTLTNTLFEIGYGSFSNRRNLLTFYNDARLHISNTGDASLIIDADIDNVGEQNNPSILLRQDAAGVYGTLGFVGDAGDIFTNSLTNAMYLINNTPSSLQLGTNNLPHVTISSAGNVGIGLTTPAYKLDVNGEITSRLANAFRLRGTTYSTILRNDNNAFYLLLTNSGDPDGTWNSLRPFSVNYSTGAVSIASTLYANNGGNVGIGTSSPAFKLDVNGAISADYYYGVENNDYMQIDANENFIYTANDVERFRITGAGYVGVGNSNPQYELDVDGYIHSTTDVMADMHLHTASSLVFGDLDYLSDYFMAYKSGTNLYLRHTDYPSGTTYTHFSLNGANGFVGIGSTSTPTYPLQVSSYRSDGYVACFTNTSTSTPHGIAVIVGDYGDAVAFVGCKTPTEHLGGLYANTSGDIYLSGTSDRRVKNSITDTKVNAVELLQKLQVRDFYFNERPAEKKTTGFIAQEVLEVLPEMVIYDEDKDLYMVAKDFLAPYFTKAIQEQQSEIEQLKSENKELKQKLDEILKLLYNE